MRALDKKQQEERLIEEARRKRDQKVGSARHSTWSPSFFKSENSDCIIGEEILSDRSRRDMKSELVNKRVCVCLFLRWESYCVGRSPGKEFLVDAVAP